MRTSMVHAVLAVLVGVACSDSVSVPTTWNATLTVGSEVPAPTGTSTLGGTAVVVIAGGGTAQGTLTYTLTLTGTPTSTISFAHIHTAAVGATGPVRVNLCGAGTAPACPTGAGSVASSATFTSGSSVVSGSPTLTFDGLVSAIHNFGAYVNVHTANNTSGESRGQLLSPGIP